MESNAATAALEGRYAAFLASASGLGSDELLDALELAQREIDAASARQAVALAHLSARDCHRQEDGTMAEVHHGLGHQRLDGPELAAPRLGVSVHVATRRMEDAIRQMTRTPAVVDAMASGDLDEHRASIVTQETEFLSPESAAEVVARVAPVWGQLTAGPLRQLLARTAAQVDPDAVTAHAEDERKRRGLTRRTGVHGTDHWRGDFRVEDARTAWAAVTERARQLVRGGAADNLEMARADAMMELILEHSDVTVVVHATRAADDTPHTHDTPHAGNATTTDATAAAATTAGATAADAGDAEADNSHASARPPHPDSGASSAKPSTSGDSMRPAAAASASGSSAAEDLVEVGGLGGPGTTFVRRDWLDAAGTSDPVRDLACDTDTGALIHGDVPPALARGQQAARRAHRARERARERARSRADTGPDAARITDAARSTSEAAAMEDSVDFSESYRVPDPMARLIRLRDGSCRFPGCAVPARQCDLDHVRPWPVGPTTPTNLMALCRRHHRIKQRDGWTVKLHPDGHADWTDPTGYQRITWPVDHLHLVTAGHTHRDALGTTTPRTPARDSRTTIDVPSTFEEELIELLGGPDKARRRAHPVVYDAYGNKLKGPPPPLDLDDTLHHGTAPWDQLILDLPPRPPTTPETTPSDELLAPAVDSGVVRSSGE
ncbi:HNH nuclease [Knoellia sinensis KCTC 19936]|uniref:HNH nuclease n=1 Tax=Knoellia sinensis KCTC 19936 TaxID=1385520 RepID=A0A0A0JF29_9MICO|nr:HNH endonuclease signature motif containing protein [Knoellia sinensis]KGN34216.1 HNH nuclease [Knoellia sinensis KCTC 19936]